MKLSIWDKLSLSVTGRLPKSTQAKVDAQVKKELDEAKAKLAAKLPKDGDGDGKIFDGTKKEKPAPKAKPATTKKPAAKKPETKKPTAKKPATKKKGSK